MRATTLLCALLFWSLTMSAQYVDAPHPSVLMDAVLDPTFREQAAPRHPPMVMPMSVTAKQLDTTIDVLSYDVLMDWSTVMSIPRAERQPRKCTARVAASIVVNASSMDTLVLYAQELVFDSISVNGSPCAHQLASQRVRIALPSTVRQGDTLHVVMHYAIMRDDLGFQSYANTDISQSGRPLAITFTFNQPEGARTWYPCNDVAYDKAMFTAHMLIPKDFVGVSNGRRISRTDVNDSVVMETWRHEQPMATYLFNMNASRFTMVPQVYVRPNGDTIPMENYQWAIDEDSATYSAKRAIRNIPEMFRVMEGFFGPYPYETYGHVSVYPIQFGGMEHQSMSMVNREWLKGTAELGYMHELGHQWFGDWVTCATWGDIWLNEGAASWTEALFAGRDGNTDGYRLRMRQRRDRYLRNGLAEPPVYDIPLSNLFNEATTYCKSAWVYHMMRTHVANDSVFFGHMRGYLEAFGRNAAQTADLHAHMKRVAPSPVVDWDVFFDQWLVQAGHPVFRGTLDLPATAEPQRTVTLTLAQVQSAAKVPEVFHVPVRLRFRSSSSTKDTVVVMTSRTITVAMTMPTEPTEVTVDPNEEILCESSVQVATGVDEQRKTAWCRLVGPIPASDHVLLQVDDQGDAAMSITDMQGRLLRTQTLSPGLHQVSLTGDAGLVMIRLTRFGSTAAFTVPVIGR
ncbi:MAG: M1 family metallopeptidase [Candidatus Kapabacteria bacterium]|nr:M1 family metallopeptidase [Candidatus Kapabacteria bacterium]